MSGRLTLNVTEFKARSLSLLEDVSRGRLEEITVTKRGRILAVVAPPPRKARSFEELYGSMKGSATTAPGVDLTEPTCPEDWEGEWLRNWDQLSRA